MSTDSFKKLRVLDMTRYLVGGFATLILADLGAEVIKVEDTGKGDFARYDEPTMNGMSYYHAALCRNKKSITLNVKSEEGNKIFMDLAKESDIIIENFRTGVTKRLGIDYETIKKINPKIIYCSISSYGQKDERSLLALHDINFQALSGYLSLNGGKTSPLHLPDTSTWTAAITGIMIALYHREVTGVGQEVDIPMYDAFLFWTSLLTNRYHFQGNSVTAETIEYPALCYNVYETKDGGRISFGMVEDKFWNEFCVAMGVEDLIPKQMLRRIDDAQAMDRMENLLKSKTLEEWMVWFKDKDVCVAPVKTVDAAVKEALASKTGIMEYVDYNVIGKSLQTKLPYRLSEIETPLQESTSPPTLGENNAEVLGKLGYTADQIKAFAEKGVIGKA